MGWILRCVCLGLVLLLFATKFGSSRSLNTYNGSIRHQLNVPARSKPQNCSHRGQSICQKYGNICVSYDGGEVCIDNPLENAITCTEESQKACERPSKSVR
ncbi:hypothetical protein MTO96_012147 [Rhipicephalus appendiculatus]